MEISHFIKLIRFIRLNKKIFKVKLTLSYQIVLN